MNKRKILPFLLLFLVLVLNGCYYDVEEELYPLDPSCQTQALTYTENIKQIISTNCAISGCHIAGTGRANLTTYTGVKQVAESGLLRQKVLVEKSMPPSGPLPDCEIRQLDAWLKAGAPEN